MLITFLIPFFLVYDFGHWTLSQLLRLDFLNHFIARICLRHFISSASIFDVRFIEIHSLSLLAQLQHIGMMNATYDETKQNVYRVEEFNAEMRSVIMPVTVFVGIQTIIAFLGNITIIYVFLMRYHMCNFRYFVLCLAFIDITSSLTAMPGEIVSQLFWYIYRLPLICKIKSFFNMFTVCGEALCLLIISFERFLKVCRPLGRQIKPRTSIWLCLGIILISIILAIPVPILWGTRVERIPYKNVSLECVVCEINSDYVNSRKPFQYATSINVFIVLCLVFMFAFYILVAKRLILDMQRLRLEENVTLPSKIDTKPKITNIDTIQSSSTHGSSCEDFQTKPVASFSTDGKYSTISKYMYASSSDSRPTPSNGQFSDTADDSSVKVTTDLISNKDCLNAMEHKRVVGTSRERLRRKTCMMLVLSVVFIVTISTYLALLSGITNGKLTKLSNKEMTIYFFFFRLYFINHCINIFVYGLLDPHFRFILQNLKRTILKCCSK